MFYEAKYKAIQSAEYSAKVNFIYYGQKWRMEYQIQNFTQTGPHNVQFNNTDPNNGNRPTITFNNLSFEQMLGFNSWLNVNDFFGIDHKLTTNDKKPVPNPNMYKPMHKKVATRNILKKDLLEVAYQANVKDYLGTNFDINYTANDKGASKGVDIGILAPGEEPTESTCLTFEVIITLKDKQSFINTIRSDFDKKFNDFLTTLNQNNLTYKLYNVIKNNVANQLFSYEQSKPSFTFETKDAPEPKQTLKSMGSAWYNKDNQLITDFVEFDKNYKSLYGKQQDGINEWLIPFMFDTSNQLNLSDWYKSNTIQYNIIKNIPNLTDFLLEAIKQSKIKGIIEFNQNPLYTLTNQINITSQFGNDLSLNLVNDLINHIQYVLNAINNSKDYSSIKDIQNKVDTNQTMIVNNQTIQMNVIDFSIPDPAPVLPSLEEGNNNTY